MRRFFSLRLQKQSLRGCVLCRILFSSNMYRIQREIASTPHRIPLVSFKFVFSVTPYVMYPIIYRVLLFQHRKSHIRITITTYFYSSTKWLYYDFLEIKGAVRLKPIISRYNNLSISRIWGFAPSPHQTAFRTFTAAFAASPFGNLRAKRLSFFLKYQVC